MLSLDQVFNKNELKFTKSQINNGLYKFGHITKEEKYYLDKIDALAFMRNNKSKDKEIANFKIDNMSSKDERFVELSISSQEVAAI